MALPTAGSKLGRVIESNNEEKENTEGHGEKHCLKGLLRETPRFGTWVSLIIKMLLKVEGAKSRTTEDTESTEFHRGNGRFDGFLCGLCVLVLLCGSRFSSLSRRTEESC
jgi:hypothetical protein